MLQIVIIHENDSVIISEIIDEETTTVLSEFDDQEDRINLEPLQSHIGEEVMITHFKIINGCTMLDCEHKSIITKVEKNEDGIWFFEYD